MGNVEHRFKEMVEAGDHSKAYELYYNKKTLRDSLNPIEKCYPDGSSILHQTARHAMQPLYETFLDNSTVDPLQLTDNGQSCIHLICIKESDPDIRHKMLQQSLQHSLTSPDNPPNEIVSQPDKLGNTPLHYACLSGLENCTMILLKAGANPTVTNKEGHTPLDLATLHKHTEIAKTLEKHIVFTVPNIENESIVVEMDPLVIDGPVMMGVAMKNQEIQSMKDILIIETSELLGVSLFTAEVLLRNNEWSKEALLDAWMSNPQSTCEKAGVDLPTILSVDNIDNNNNNGEDDVFIQEKLLVECSICYCDPCNDIQIPCEHVFCTDCWQLYLHEKISNGKVGEIACPEYACYKLVPIHIVEKLVSREMAKKYLQYDIKSFVDTNPNIRWCPHPGCGQAVQKPPPEYDPNDTSPDCLFVHCGNDHYFCWLCGEIGHSLSSCKDWEDWLNKVKELTIKLGNMTSSQVSDAASSQWVSNNSKPCPSCSVPIEKTSGCNHMKCYKCKHDFCWMCLDRWIKHSSSTGGYFECNRYKEIEKVNEKMGDKKSQDDYELLSHFRHYYDRYINHIHSLKLESQYLYDADCKMAELKQLASSEREGVQFVKDAVRQLVIARHTLIASYGYGYYIMIRKIKEQFERLQGDFEEHVEALAEVVARPHLRKSKYEIIQLTNCVSEKRQFFINKIEEGLQPPTPTMQHLMKRTIANEQTYGEESQLQERREEERLLRQAIQESTREYQTQARLNSDTELAILLSIQDQEPPSPQGLSNGDPIGGYTPIEEGYTPIEERYTPIGGYTPIGHGYANNPMVASFTHHSTSQNSQTSSDNVIDLDKWRRTLLEGPTNWSSSSSSSVTPNPSCNHTPNMTPSKSSVKPQSPFSMEDEELQTALALSLSVANNTDNNNVYNNLDI